MQLTKIKDLVLSNGGATLTQDLDNAIINDGYMVSLKDHELKIRIESLTSNLLDQYRTIAMHNNAYVGLWLDGQDLYLDISTNIHNRDEAIKIAQDNEQLAIYDCKTANSIYL